jgi:putative hydrolase of the HAD superfamily
MSTVAVGSTDWNQNDNPSRITTLIFDVDDTLYDVHTGFTEERNGSAVHQFMVEYLNFPSVQSAKIVRDEYFERYHATAKGLQIAEKEGRFPPIQKDERNDNQSSDHEPSEPRFKVQDLSIYWATKLDYTLLGGIKTKLIKDLLDLRSMSDVKLIAFSNGPRNYVIRVLQELGLWNTVFTENTLFAVDDVLPYCKPEKEAFEAIFKKLGGNIITSECIMIEDSLKNISRAKELGMKTVFVKGSGQRKVSNAIDSTTDSHDNTHDSIDIVIETIEELRGVIPGLWRNPAMFEFS